MASAAPTVEQDPYAMGAPTRPERPEDRFSSEEHDIMNQLFERFGDMDGLRRECPQLFEQFADFIRREDNEHIGALNANMEELERVQPELAEDLKHRSVMEAVGSLRENINMLEKARNDFFDQIKAKRVKNADIQKLSDLLSGEAVRNGGVIDWSEDETKKALLDKVRGLVGEEALGKKGEKYTYSEAEVKVALDSLRSAITTNLEISKEEMFELQSITQKENLLWEMIMNIVKSVREIQRQMAQNMSSR
jgi:hypothetical protein